MPAADASSTTASRAGRITILMGTYNGAAYLPDQLASLTRQTMTRWDLVVGDDGSTDSTLDILTGFAEAQILEKRTVEVRPGPGQGVAVNFLTLLASLPETVEWVALSDQDDVWLPDRLQLGQSALSRVPLDEPALFGSATWVVNEDLSEPRHSPQFQRPPSFANALVQSIAGGNTMLLNPAGARLARVAAREALSAGGPVTHDWWLYQLIAGAGGTVLRDERPTLLYRQHDRNLFGANRGWRASALRLRQVVAGDLANWVAQNNRALLASAERLTPGNRRMLDRFATMGTQDVVSRLRCFRQLGLHRQGKASQAAIWVAAALGRL